MKFKTASIASNHISSTRSFPKGITLVEILVVIVIMLILVGISVPVTQRMRAKGHSAGCLNNVRQVGAALLMATYDNNNQFPSLDVEDPDGRKTIWPENLAFEGYLGGPLQSGKMPCGEGVWACPSAEKVADTHGGYGVSEGGMFNYIGQDGSRPPESRLSAVERPEKTWLVGDATNDPSNMKKPWYAIWENPATWTGHAPAPRHGNKVHVCMVDGHVEAISVKELKDGRYTFAKK